MLTWALCGRQFHSKRWLLTMRKLYRLGNVTISQSDAHSAYYMYSTSAKSLPETTFRS